MCKPSHSTQASTSFWHKIDYFEPIEIPLSDAAVISKQIIVYNEAWNKNYEVKDDKNISTFKCDKLRDCCETSFLSTQLKHIT